MASQQKGATTRVAVVSDIHYGKGSAGLHQQLFAEISQQADLLLLAGDLTDYGLPEEAEVLVKDLQSSLRVPVVCVLGNHDFESGQQQAVMDILCAAGVSVLDGDAVEIGDVGIAGIKGFCGGFGRGTLGYWGEAAIKAFVQEGIDETLKLESALARLRTPHRIALLHYAPIVDTVMGEPEVIFPFLGTSRHEEPLNRFKVDVVFHGHAHNGTFEGRTSAGIPVYNVSHHLLKKTFPDDPAFRIFEFAKAEQPPAVIEHEQEQQAGRK